MQRIQVFLLLLIGSLVMFSLAIFVFLPMVLLVPTKFALSFTLGSLMFMTAFAILNGPRSTLRQLIARDRIVFSTLYTLSIGA